MLPPDLVPWQWLQQLTETSDVAGRKRLPGLALGIDWAPAQRLLEGRRLLTLSDDPRFARLHRVLGEHIKRVVDEATQNEFNTYLKQVAKQWREAFDARMFVVLALTIGDRLSDGSLGLTNAEAILTDLARNRSAGIDTTRFLIIHEWRADLLAQSGDSETALDRYCQSLRIRERLVQANPDEPRYLRALAAAHGRVGDLLASMREDGRALDH